MKLLKQPVVLAGMIVMLLGMNALKAQVGYFDAPYQRYEADLGVLTNATVTAKSYAQGNLQSEASDQVCVNMSGAGSAVAWKVTAQGDGLVVRYSLPDGQSGALDVYSNNAFVGTLNLSSYYSWEYLSSNGNPNNTNVTNTNPKMRFDEVRMRLPAQIAVGGSLKLVWKSGNIALDFAELEAVPAAVPAVSGAVVYGGNGSDLQNFINNNGGQNIYVPAGYYNVPGELYLGINNTTLRGAGMWYTELHFTNNGSTGGLRANAYTVSFSDLYLTTVRNSRTNSYKAINGVYTAGSVISNIWEEHFECGAWIAQFNNGGPAIADGFLMKNCRFRNNYADGSNLSKGTSNAIVEHCSYRNNGDDDMGIWSANGMECRNNTFRFNTAENSWRASGCAIYGGYSNIAHDLLIKDNLEVGLRVNNSFPGAPFNTGGMHQFYNIRIVSGGTYNDLFNSPVGAIDLVADNKAGTTVYNVKFSCIEIIDSKNDAIYIQKTNGSGFSNLVFENITVNGTGREYPNNNAGNGNGGARGFGLLFWGSPSGNGTYCNMTYANRGGNAGADVNTANIGAFNWSQAGTCPGGCVSMVVATTTITSAATLGVCNNPYTFSATATVPAGNTIASMAFFVDNNSIGTDNSSPYNVTLNNPAVGQHVLKVVTSYSGGTTSTSSQNLTVAEGVYPSNTAPVIDGLIDPLWNACTSFSLNKISQGTISGPLDLSATFKMTRDASNLYILVNVTDDILRNNGTLNYQNDALELLIDMGNKKNTSYGASDFQYNFIYGRNTVSESQNNAVAGVVLAQTVKSGPSGYIMEIAIPWSTLGGAPAANSFMGFELGVDDNDNDLGNRDAKIAWTDQTDMAYQNPSLFGTLQIAGCPPPATTPVADFTFAPGTACTGQAVQFTDVSLNTPSSWTWNFGTGANPSTFSGQNPPAVVYNSAGNKTITLTATNSAGTNSATKTTTITTVPAQPGAISGALSPCNGTQTQYSIAAVAGATSYTWTMPNGWTGSSSSTSIQATPNTSSGNVTVLANNSCGASPGVSLTVTPSSSPAQPGAISGAVAPCPGGATTYTIPAMAGATSYTWTLPNGWSGTSNTQSINVTPGNTSGDIIVVANMGCGTSPGRTLTVSPSATPAQPGNITGPTSVCNGVTVSYSVAAVSGAANYVWTLPAGWSGTSNSSSISVNTSSNSGTISVSAINSCGTSAAQSIGVGVNGNLTAPGAINGPSAPCSNSNATYSITPVSGATSYTWTLPNGWTGTSASATISVTTGNTSGNITVSSNNTCGNSPSSNLAVSTTQSPGQPTAINGPGTTCPGTSLNYTIQLVSGASSYNWTLPNGWSGTSSTNNIAATAGTTGGSISVSANGTCGTSPTKTLSVTVINVPVTPGAISGAGNPCLGGTGTYSISAVPSASAYIWTLPSGWSGSSSSTSITATPNSQGTILVAASNVCGTSSNNSFVVTPSNTQAPVVSLKDKTVCADALPVIFDAGSPGLTYMWSDNGIGTNQTTPGNVPGKYTVTVTNSNNCSSTVSAMLKVNPMPVIKMTDMSLCEEDPGAFFDAGNAGSSYVWSGQGTGFLQTTPALVTGTYTVVVTTAANCSTKGSANFILKPKPKVHMENKTLCAGDPATSFDAGNAGALFLWSGLGKGTAQTTLASSPGSYSVTVTNSSKCSTLASANLVRSAPVIPELGVDTSYCEGQSLVLNSGLIGTYSYSWMPYGGNEGTLKIVKPGKYKIVVKDLNGCIGSDSVLVNLSNNCGDQVPDWPTVITPNGDGLNDVFKLRNEKSLLNAKNIKFEVFDRWGQLKFASENIAPVWDAFSNGILVAAGTYYFVLHYENSNGIFELPGFFTVIN